MGLFDGTPLERPITCERCGEEEKNCVCPPVEVPDTPPERQRLRLKVEKRKRGKVVTVITGFDCTSQQRQWVLTQLKNYCGAGGSIDANSLEIQGDHAERLRTKLQDMGYQIAK